MRKAIACGGLALALAGCGASAAPGSDGPAANQAHTEQALVTILHQVPLPPGTHVATAAEARSISWQEHPDSQHLVSRHTTYLVPMSAVATLAWYGEHQPPGTSSTGSSSRSGPGGAITQGVEYYLRNTDHAFSDPEVQVGVLSRSAEQSLLRIDVQATWLPGDQSQARVPLSTTSIEVHRVDDSGAVQDATWGAGPARRLAALIDRQHVAGPGTYNCPDDRGGHDLLTFHGPWPDRRYTVDAEGCGFIDGRIGQHRFQTAFFGGQAVDAMIRHLLGIAGS